MYEVGREGRFVRHLVLESLEPELQQRMVVGAVVAPLPQQRLLRTAVAVGTPAAAVEVEAAPWQPELTVRTKGSQGLAGMKQAVEQSGAPSNWSTIGRKIVKEVRTDPQIWIGTRNEEILADPD